MRRASFPLISIGLGILLALLTMELVLRFLPVNEGARPQVVDHEHPVRSLEPNRTFVWSADWNFAIINTVRTNNLGFVNDQDYLTDQPSPDRYMLVRLRFKGAATSDPVVADIVRKFNVEVSVLYGNIDYIQDEPFGYLIVVIMGDMETQAKAFSYIKTLPIGSEVLGYVPRNH